MLLRDPAFRHSEGSQVFERKINAAFCVIHTDVLPEIGELQRSACVIRELLALRIAISAQVQHQMANRISRVMAVSENIIERLESRDRLILTEGGQQVRELVLGNIELPHGFRQGDEHRMFRSALIA